jgi:hypothetical protein
MDCEEAADYDRVKDTISLWKRNGFIHREINAVLHAAFQVFLNGWHNI